MAQIVVNGESRELPTGGQSVRELLAAMGASGERVAVMVNGMIVTQAGHESTALSARDHIEVLTLARGG